VSQEAQILVITNKPDWQAKEALSANTFTSSGGRGGSRDIAPAASILANAAAREPDPMGPPAAIRISFHSPGFASNGLTLLRKIAMGSRNIAPSDAKFAFSGSARPPWTIATSASPLAILSTFSSDPAV